MHLERERERGMGEDKGVRPFSLGSLSRVRERTGAYTACPEVSVDGKKEKNYGEGNKANKA